MASFISGPTHEYRAVREMIDMTSYSSEPDPNWRYTDAAGHDHDSEWTLLIRKQDNPDEPPFWFDSDGDEHNAPSHLECSLCGETIKPGMIGPSPFRRLLPGLTRYYRDDVEITEAEWIAETRGIASR